MIIALPIHKSTPGVDQIASDFKKKGTLKDHTLRVISTRADEDLAFSIADELSDHFRAVTTQTLATGPRNGTKLANDMFFAAFKWHFNYKPGDGEITDPPMMYFDPTYRPAAINWVDQLQAEFYLKDSPAVLARTLTEGKGTTFARTTVGPVIIGRKFLRDCTLIDFLGDQEHWRVRMRHELAKDCAETLQIGGGHKSLLKPTKSAKV